MTTQEIEIKKLLIRIDRANEVLLSIIYIGSGTTEDFKEVRNVLNGVNS